MTSVLLALVAGCAGPPVDEARLIPAQVRTGIEQPSVRDGRVRFREIFCGLLDERFPAPAGDAPRPACEDFLSRLVDEADPGERPRAWLRDTQLRIVVVPGLFNECLPEVMPFADAVRQLGDRGYPISTLVVSGRSSADANARQIADEVDALRQAGAERLLLVGYSKGAVDSLHFLVNHPELAGRVAAVASVAGAINGSPLAERLARLYAGFGADLPIEACDPGDGGAVESLKPSVRTSWLARNRLPDSVRYFSLASHSDREQVSPGLSAAYDLLASLDPRNDGQLLAVDQVIPGATLLGYAKADHWRFVIARKTAPNYMKALLAKDPFPHEVLLEAIILYVAESLRQDAPAGARGALR